MLLKTYEKQPWEVKDYDVTFDEWLTQMVPNDALSNATATVAVIPNPKDTSADTTTLLVDSIDITATMVKLGVSAGTHNKNYKVTLRVTTQGLDGFVRKDESELIFKVKDQ